MIGLMILLIAVAIQNYLFLVFDSAPAYNTMFATMALFSCLSCYVVSGMKIRRTN